MAGAVTSAVRAETLQDAWREALTHNQSLAAASSEVDAARANERAARGARWPSVAADAGYTRLNASPALDMATPTFMFQSGPVFRDNQYVAGTVQMKLPLYAGGQITAGIDAARSALTAASENEGATASALKLQVAEAYVGVLRAQHAFQAAQASADSLTAHVADVQRRVEDQSVATSDLLAARVALAGAEEARVHAASAVQIAQAAYNRLLGQPLDRLPDLDDHVPADIALADVPVATLIGRALAARGEVKAATAEADALEFQSRAERGKLRPQLALSGGYAHFDNQILDRENYAMVGIGVTWSLFDGGQARNRAQALESASRAERDRMDDLRSQIALQVRQSWLAVQDAQARVKAASQAVAQAEENLRDSRQLYDAGLATNTQVLDAVTLRTTAINSHDNALLDISLSLLRLAYTIGSL
jgi:outer membrane protein TolC